MENFDELQEIRQQMNLLQQKLQEQTFINERMIKRTVRRKRNMITSFYTINAVVCLLLIPLTYLVFYLQIGISFQFWIATCALMLLCIAYDIMLISILNRTDLAKNTMLEVGRNVVLAKKWDNRWLLIGLPLGVLWAVYLIIEGRKATIIPLDENTAVTLIMGMLAGMTIGLVLHMKNQKNYRKLLDAADDLDTDD